MAERNVLLKNVKHPFLVGLHYSFQTTEKLYFVLDFVNGGEVRDAAFGSESFCLLIPGGGTKRCFTTAVVNVVPVLEVLLFPVVPTDCHSFVDPVPLLTNSLNLKCIPGCQIQILYWYLQLHKFTLICNKVITK